MRPKVLTPRWSEDERALRLWRRADGRLVAGQGSRTVPVRVARCFPWSEPAAFVSLRDDDDEEVAFLRSPAELPEPSRKVLEEALAEAGFVFEVESLLEVTDEIEIRRFRVRTRQGPRSFQTHRDEWPRELPGGGLLIRDVVGDLYLVRDPRNLDRRSAKLLWPFLD